MKNRKLWNILAIAALVIQVLAEGAAVFFVLQLNMLPDLYLWLLVGAFVLLTAVSAAVALLEFRKPVGIVRRIIGILLALLIAAGCVIMSCVITQLHDTVQEITQPEVTTTTRDVFVMKDDPAKTLSDAKDYTFGFILEYDTENTRKALALLEKELGKPVTTMGFESAPAMIDALYSGQVGALIMDPSYLSILEDTEEYEDFGDKTRILYEVQLEQKLPEPVPETTVTQTTKPTQPEQKAPLAERPFVIYLSGSDTRYQKLGNKTRSDVNILLVVNPETKQILLINTPRDYYVANPAGGGAMDKLTHCGIYGTDCSVQALEGLYNIDIDYYAKINFTGFKTLIDEIGGVTVYSSKTFTSRGVTFQKGKNNLDGKQALIFARERYSLAGGDRDRGKNQMKIVEAVIQKLTSSTTLISNYSDILKSLKGMLKTDIPMEELSGLVKFQLEEMPQWEVKAFAVSGKTGKDKNYSMPGLKASVMYQDEKLVAQATGLVNKMLQGQLITDEDLKVS